MTNITTVTALRDRLAELAGTWTLDPAHTSIELSVRHMMVGTVRGRVAPVDGALHIDANEPEQSYVEIEIDAGSIDTGNSDRDVHLKSPDFLDVETYPRIAFRSTGLEDHGDGDFIVRGDLTVRDVTQPVTLEAEFGGIVRDPWGNHRIGFTAQTTIDRTAFGLKWNAALEGGGIVVGTKVKLSIDTEFTRPAAG